MSGRTFYPRRKHREHKPQDLETRKEEDSDCLQQFSHCPACNKQHDTVLILPCSHTMCSHCIAAGEGVRSGPAHHGSLGLPACSVLCPGCRRHVELPCWDWSSATSCLPKHPSLSLDPEDPPQHVQGDRSSQDGSDRVAQSRVHGFSAGSSSVAPVGGVVDLREEEMEQSVFGLSFALDPSTVPPSVRLSNLSLTITYQGESSPGPPPDHKARISSMTSDPKDMLGFPQVSADVVIVRGQYYWEVDVCNSSVYRIGVSSSDGSGGWWLERRGLSFCTVYDGSQEAVCSVPPQIKTLGVFLNVGGGALSFHNPLTQEHLATLPTRFHPAGVVPALGLGQGRLRLRSGLPAPPHVFLSKDSAYRGPCGAAGGRWHREIPFQSVRRVIQKFEELAVSDSDSGLVSSSGSSSSTLASLSDLRTAGFPSGPAGQVE